MREPVRERAVVREEKRAGRIDVEPPDGDNARRERDELDDGAPPLRVASGGDDALRLVEEDVRKTLARDFLPVDFDAVVLADDGVQLARSAVDGDAAILDELVGAPPRGDAGTREEGVQPHCRETRQRLPPVGSSHVLASDAGTWPFGRGPTRVPAWTTALGVPTGHVLASDARTCP